MCKASTSEAITLTTALAKVMSNSGLTVELLEHSSIGSTVTLQYVRYSFLNVQPLSMMLLEQQPSRVVAFTNSL